LDSSFKKSSIFDVVRPLPLRPILPTRSKSGTVANTSVAVEPRASCLVGFNESRPVIEAQHPLRSLTSGQLGCREPSTAFGDSDDKQPTMESSSLKHASSWCMRIAPVA